MKARRNPDVDCGQFGSVSSSGKVDTITVVLKNII